ncbi:MAG: GGDEF domain-containing protein [Gammaproteobacteria bacterium]|jgi:diguanylate cyclase (GGDEF)-like protein/PAS domain S-box-containing protein
MVADTNNNRQGRWTELAGELNSLRRELGMSTDQTFLLGDAALDALASHLASQGRRGFILIHDRQRALSVSPAVGVLTGWNPDRVRGQSLQDLIHPDDQMHCEACIRCEEGATTVSNEPFRMRCANGNWRWFSCHASPFGEDEVVWWLQDAGELHELRRELAQARRELAALSAIDALTGLYNRRKLNERLTQLVREAKRGRRFVCALVDIDGFKAFNDSYGRAAGDRVLVGFGKTLVSTCRDVDFAGRYGGDEFVVLYVDTDLKTGRKLADRQRKELARRKTGHAGLTVSIGLTDCPPEVDSTLDLIRRADKALREAKLRGPNRVEICETA